MRVPYSHDRVAKIKTVDGRRWHQQEKHWTVPRTDRTIAQVLALFPGEPTEVDPSLDALHAPRQEKRVLDTDPAMLERLGTALCAWHYVRRTEQAYGHWIKRFTRFHHGRQPAEMAEPEINRFPTHLAVTEKVSASTQNQALAAVLFLYRHGIGRDIGDISEVIRARKPERLPVVMAREEVKAVLANLTGDKWLIAAIMHGAGLRLMECLRLRVQDLDCSRNEILIRDGKGAKDRMTMLPESVKAPRLDHLTKVKTVHQRDLAEGVGPRPASRRPRPQVPQCATGLALALGVSPGSPMGQWQDQRTKSPSH